MPAAPRCVCPTLCSSLCSPVSKRICLSLLILWHKLPVTTAKLPLAGEIWGLPSSISGHIGVFVSWGDQHWRPRPNASWAPCRTVLPAAPLNAPNKPQSPLQLFSLSCSPLLSASPTRNDEDKSSAAEQMQPPFITLFLSFSFYKGQKKSVSFISFVI